MTDPSNPSTYDANVSKSERNVGIQIIRAIAALLVVAQHSKLSIKLFDNCYWLDGHERGYPFFVNHLYAGVNIFFCVSGYIMSMILSRSGLSVAKYCWDRLIKIYPPYIFCTVFVFLVFLISHGHFNVGHISGSWLEQIFHVISSAALIPQPTSPVLPVGWTLIHEMIFYVVCILCIWRGRGRALTQVLLVLSVIAAVLLLAGKPLAYGYVCSPFELEFLIGSIAYRIRANWTSRARVAFGLGSLSLFLITSFVLTRDLNFTSSDVIRVVGFGLCGLMLILALDNVIISRPSKSWSITASLLVLGDASYSLYLSHWLVLSGIGKLASRFSHQPIYFVVIWHVASFMIAVISGVVLYYVAERPTHSMLTKLGKSYFKRDVNGQLSSPPA